MQTELTSREIEANIARKTAEMDQQTKNCNYVEAENCRIALDQLKKSYDLRVLYELEEQHAKSYKDYVETHQKELLDFNNLWEKKVNQANEESEKMKRQMTERHEKELKASRQDLQKQLSSKVKESSELLDLRKKEQNMAKQKKFVEAHAVQQKIAVLQKQEKEAWMASRNQKIQTALTKLKSKQSAEMTALLKKIDTTAKQQAKIRSTEEERMKLKFSNACKDMKMMQEKELLAQKGKFKSKGGVTGASPSMTKSRFKS